LVKPVPEAAVQRWIAAQVDTALFVSAMTLAELQRGVARLPVSRRQTELTAWLQQLEQSFGKRLLPFTQHTAPHWATMCARAQAAGQTMAAFDSIIAATALEHGLALVTRNVANFAQAPVMLVNPWTDAH
jgi:toxin FitB